MKAETLILTIGISLATFMIGFTIGHKQQETKFVFAPVEQQSNYTLWFQKVDTMNVILVIENDTMNQELTKDQSLTISLK
jgi:hypothetical protein